MKIRFLSNIKLLIPSYSIQAAVETYKRMLFHFDCYFEEKNIKTAYNYRKTNTKYFTEERKRDL